MEEAKNASIEDDENQEQFRRVQQNQEEISNFPRQYKVFEG